MNDEQKKNKMVHCQRRLKHWKQKYFVENLISKKNFLRIKRFRKGAGIVQSSPGGNKRQQLSKISSISSGIGPEKGI